MNDIFSYLYPKYIINKPIRLIELFGGYGSQHFALEYLDVNFEHWKLCEWAVKSIQAYKDAHYSYNNNNYSKILNKEQLIEYLFNKHISMDYNEPMPLKQIQSKSEDWLRNVYNNIIATKNTVDITQTKANDLEIVDTDKYTYIMTYSFPCQDLSLAGLGKGMARDSGTRSGMLWQVERILDECLELPQILLMENVPEVKGAKNVKYFNEWQHKLESLGYKNYHQNLIATDYGIPQTRNRTFMVSILGNYSYTFPNPIPLKLKLKDMLENNVDEKYYLSDKQLEQISNWNAYQNPFDTIDKENCPTLTTRSGAFAAGMVLTKDTENYIEWEEKGKLDIDCRAFKEDKAMSTIMTTPKNKVLTNSVNLKTQLCNELISKGVVKENDVIKHSYTNNKLDDDRLVPNHNISPTLDTRCDCLGVVVKEATKKGYAIATNGDGVYINRPEQKRDCVQKDKIQTLKTSLDVGVVDNLRIRKLTPKECFRLMGVKDEDYERIAKNQSDASLYHLAGDSIVVNVLMAIFKQFFESEVK